MLPKMKFFSHMCASPFQVALWTCAGIYLVAILYIRHITYLDPRSWFFDEKLAYTRIYSEVRRQQADEYIRTATKPNFPALLRDSSRPPGLCVGVAGLLEDPARYLETSIGSLLEGLSGYERKSIHLSVYLVHRREHPPSTLPAYFRPWMDKLVDELQLYQLPNITSDTTDHLTAVEDARPYYTDLMKSCYESKAPYMAIFEDEIIAMDGWFHRTMQAIDQIQALTIHDEESAPNFRINLFYPEVYRPRWHPEDATYEYIVTTTAAVAAFAAVLFTARQRSSCLKPYLPIRVILVVSCICTPAVIVLAISAGWSIYDSLPQLLNRLESHYSDSQGYVFSRQQAKEVIEMNHDKHALGASEVINGGGSELVWTLNPSVIQHVGRHSLKGDYFKPATEADRAAAEELFSFAFELNDAEQLRKEHLKVTGQDPERNDQHRFDHT